MEPDQINTFRILDALTIISFLLSTTLTIRAYILSRIRVKLEVQRIYAEPDSFVMKIFISNLATTPRSITKITFVDKYQSILIDSFTFEKWLHSNRQKNENTKKNEVWVMAQQQIYSDKIPINIAPQTAVCAFIYFPNPEFDFEKLLNDKSSLHMVISGKRRSLLSPRLIKLCPYNNCRNEH